jgi:predicted dehydrogenase
MSRVLRETVVYDGDRCGSYHRGREKGGCAIGLGHERHFEPAVIEMRRRLESGEFGNLLLLEGNFSQDKFLKLPSDNWRLSNSANPVGPLSATGIQMVDLSIALLGRPISV